MYEESPNSGGRKAPRPLDKATLNELALTYVARFATSAGKLTAYLRRKLRERGWSGEGEPDIAALIGRFVDLGYVDDAGYARAKAGSLLRRGYGEKRVEQALTAAGIAEQNRASARGSEREKRAAALLLARKRRFGPFSRQAAGDERLDPALREKQVAAMLRAGHPLATARVLVNAPTVEAAESWADVDDDDV